MHTHAHTHAPTHTHTDAHRRTHMHTHTHTHRRTHTDTRTRARTHTHVHAHAHTHTHRFTHTHMHACTHAHTHTHTHVYLETHPCWLFHSIHLLSITIVRAWIIFYFWTNIHVYDCFYVCIFWNMNLPAHFSNGKHLTTRKYHCHIQLPVQSNNKKQVMIEIGLLNGLCFIPFLHHLEGKT